MVSLPEEFLFSWTISTDFVCKAASASTALAKATTIMPAEGPLPAELESFSGRAPLFPLSGIVLFPQALLPLHIFEPRYRKMTADALEGEQLIAMAHVRAAQPVLLPGMPPAVYPVVGLGKIIAHEKLADGRYYLVLKGLARMQIESELDLGLPYRVGQLKLAEDRVVAAGHGEEMRLAKSLVETFSAIYPKIELVEVFEHALQSPAVLSIVTDLLASTIPMIPEMGQMLLEERSPERRADTLMGLLLRASQLGQGKHSSEKAPPTGFPPRFSDN